MPDLYILRALTALAVTGLSALTDLVGGKIYNIITIPAICIAICLAALGTPDADPRSLNYIASFIIILVAAFLSGALGGGDLKLIIFLAVLYPDRCFIFIISASFIAAAAYIAMRGVVCRIVTGQDVRDAVGRSIPLAPFIFTGTLLLFASGRAG